MLQPASLATLVAPYQCILLSWATLWGREGSQRGHRPQVHKCFRPLQPQRHRSDQLQPHLHHHEHHQGSSRSLASTGLQGLECRQAMA